MICCECNNDLATCVCPDLEERFNDILQCQFVHIGAEYQERIKAWIEKRKEEREVQE